MFEATGSTEGVALEFNDATSGCADAGDDGCATCIESPAFCEGTVAAVVFTDSGTDSRDTLRPTRFLSSCSKRLYLDAVGPASDAF